MYEQFYGFSERPFSLLPDPDFLFPGEKHRAALDALELAIFNQSGFCVISGEIGAGKTTLVRELLNRLSDDVQVGLVSNTHPSFGELMQWVMTAYGLPGGTDDQLELHKRFIDFAIQRYAEGKHTLLIIDEAQNLSLEALEELRMLSNVNSGKDLVLQIIMVGQSELREKLRKPELAQFAQRISIDYYLGGLNSDETCLYIQHRVVHAGGAADLFTRDACQRVFEFSQGIPRVINRLCDLGLVYGYAMHREHIDAGLIEAVAREQQLGEAMEAARRRTAVAPTEDEPVVPGESVLLKTENDTPEPLQASGSESTVEPDSVAGQSRSARGERSALWLFVGVAVMVGVTAWASRDAWLLASKMPETAIAPVATEKKDSPDVTKQARHEEEARVAKQRAAEKAKQEQVKREKARREKEARLAKQRAAEKARLEQAERENIVSTTAVKPVSRDSVPIPAGWANTLEWSEEDDDELSIETPVVEAVVAQPAETATATALTTGKENSDDAAEPAGFATNPCNGPTARFLSTCR